MPPLFPSLWVKYRGGSFVVTGHAQSGVDIVAATWPWALGVSFGAVRERPRIRDGEFVPCPSFTLSLNFDRRLMAGAPAARFFARVLDLLSQPVAEMERTERAVS
jgi:pyruvate/2-oxoglutarate dehydrogenase complex dihydrolipoamide acyltransferase (E2) component